MCSWLLCLQLILPSQVEVIALLFHEWSLYSHIVFSLKRVTTLRLFVCFPWRPLIETTNTTLFKEHLCVWVCVCCPSFLVMLLTEIRNTVQNLRFLYYLPWCISEDHDDCNDTKCILYSLETFYFDPTTNEIF